MKIKFITAIYCNLSGTIFGGRSSRGSHYRYSLLSLLKMTDADFTCYTSEEELDSLKQFFFVENSISEEKLKLVVFDISKTKFSDLINTYKDVPSVISGDRCVEIQYSKFHWWWNEDKSYDYYYWIDAGLSHCGLIPNKYLSENGHPLRRYYESNLFNNNFLHKLIEYTDDKFFIIMKENVRNYWSGTVGAKWYKSHCSDHHVIGGLFGGKKEIWDDIVRLFEEYTERILKEDNVLRMEENIMSLMYYNHTELFKPQIFDTWWHEDERLPGLDTVEHLKQNKSFYKIIEELNNSL